MHLSIEGRSMSIPPIRILLAEYVPSLNKGELAILNGVLQTFSMLDKVEVTVFSLNPEIDRTLYPSSVKAIDLGRNLHLRSPLYGQSEIYLWWASFFAAVQHLMFICLYQLLGRRALGIMGEPLWKTYYDYDVFIVCHDEVDCVNGAFLKFSPIYISVLARVLGKPVVFYANGTTDFTNEVWIWRLRTRRLWRLLARYVSTFVTLITVRDEDTFYYLKNLSHNRVPIYYTADPAFLLSSAGEEKTKQIMMREKIERNGRLLIGVAMTYEVLSEAFNDKSGAISKYKRAVKEIASFLDRLTEEANSLVVFIPHSVELGSRDDRVVARDICRVMTNKKPVRAITNDYTPEELKALIGQLDVLVTCRIHAAISALSMGVPSFVITRSWDKRAENIIGKMARQERWIYDVRNLDSDDLFCFVSQLLDVSSKIREDLPPIIGRIRERALLNGVLLRSMLNSRKTTHSHY